MQGYKYGGETCTGCAKLKFYDGACKDAIVTKRDDGSVAKRDRALDISFENATGYKVWFKPAWCGGKSTDAKAPKGKVNAV